MVASTYRVSVRLLAFTVKQGRSATTGGIARRVQPRARGRRSGGRRWPPDLYGSHTGTSRSTRNDATASDETLRQLLVLERGAVPARYVSCAALRRMPSFCIRLRSVLGRIFRRLAAP